LTSYLKGKKRVKCNIGAGGEENGILKHRSSKSGGEKRALREYGLILKRLISDRIGIRRGWMKGRESRA